MERYKASPLCRGVMKDFLQVNPRTDCSQLFDDSLISFVPMINVQEKNNCVQYDSVAYKTVKKGFTVFRKDDLIWAKITPCMQNGKSCVVSEMPTEIGFGSTEFHVIRKKTNEIYMPFIWALFSNDNVLKAAQAVFSGSAGQQRVAASFIERFPAVLPTLEKQVEMVKNLELKLKELNSKLHLADELLLNFENRIAQICGLAVGSKSNLCFAIKFSNLDGVIDVKRYSSFKNQKHDLCVSDICTVLDEKINVSAYQDNIIDWIRIDDLDNKPVDIKSVRTQLASEIEGAFFKVNVGDILVARLGPTILNQKIVMVRNLSRETIASSEFLVLRCKEGYNAEAVMAILKTNYYRDLMYSHSRGSTPSRYRLNRKDMLSLPFPNIIDIQEDISNSAAELRLEVTKLRIIANDEWHTAKSHFEAELLGESMGEIEHE